jgi:hypothetical protein
MLEGGMLDRGILDGRIGRRQVVDFVGELFWGRFVIEHVII